MSVMFGCRHLLHTRKRPSIGGAVPSSTPADVHDSHKYSVHTSCTVPSLHFHLAASINSNTGQSPCIALI